MKILPQKPVSFPVEVELTEEEKAHIYATLDILHELKENDIVIYDDYEELVNDEYLENAEWILEELVEGFIGDYHLHKWIEGLV